MTRENPRGLSANCRGATIKIGNAADWSEKIFAAIAQRAYEIFERRGREPGHDQEDWRAAEAEILCPLSCGVLDSKDEIDVSLACPALGDKEIAEIEACAEPSRLIFIGRKRSKSERDGKEIMYRVFPLKEECDPSSVRLHRHGPIIEIALHKKHARNDGAVAANAA